MLFLERDSQLQRLARWHEEVPTCGGCVVLVTGEAGIGKTSLVREFLRKRGTAVRTLWGVCDPLSTPQPLGPLRDVSRQVGGALAEALQLGTSRERIFAAMLDEIDRAGERVVLVIEDMHWADEASLDLLKYLGRRIARTRAMLIATYRADEVGARHPLQVAIGYLPGEAVHRLPLPSLSPSAVAELAHDSGREAEGLHAATMGNPFYVTEVLAAPAGEVPASVRDAVLARIGRLSQSAREVAELAALVPGRTETWLIQELLNASEATIDECRSSGMTRDHEGSLAFRHELSRRAVEDSLGPAETRALHQKILGVLTKIERRGISESRLVHHATGAGDIDALIKFAPLAAECAATVSAHREAVAYLRATLAHEDRLPPAERARLLDSLGYELYLTDQAQEATEARTRALQLWRTSSNSLRAGDCLRWLSRLSWFRGLGHDGERYAMQAVTELEPLGVSHELAMAYSNVAQIAMLAARNERAIEWGERAIVLAKQLGSDEILAHALNNVGIARSRVIGDAGWKEVEQSLQISLRGGLQEHVARAYTNLSSAAIAQRDYVTASTNLEAGIAYCAERELDAWNLYMRAYRARALFEQSAWTEAMADAELLLSRPGSSVPHRVQALTVMGRVLTRRGDEGAEGPLEKANALAIETNEAQRISVVAVAFAELAWLRGDLKGTALAAARGLESAMHGENAWTQGELAFWLWRAGVKARTRMRPAEPFRLHMAGDFIGAANAWAAIGCRYEEAGALADSHDEAHRRRALEIFEGLGARPMARRLRKQLQAEGLRGLKRGANRATRANPAGLTARELEILGLLTQNLSNAAIARRLFLSEKTVGHHASAILAKLGIASRREAGDAARRLGIELGEAAKAPK
jgi:DNA-binding CsgD family transcriptional regulator